MSTMAKNDPIPVEDQSLNLRQIIGSSPALIHTGWPDGHPRFLRSNVARVRRTAARGFAGLGVDRVRPSRECLRNRGKWREFLASGETLLHEARILRMANIVGS